MQPVDDVPLRVLVSVRGALENVSAAWAANKSATRAKYEDTCSYM